MISDPWIDRTWRKPVKPKHVHRGARTDREFKTDIADRIMHVDRRNELRAAGLCINGPRVGNVGASGVVHGPVFRLSRCLHCYLVKTKHDDRR